MRVHILDVHEIRNLCVLELFVDLRFKGIEKFFIHPTAQQ